MMEPWRGKWWLWSIKKLNHRAGEVAWRFNSTGYFILEDPAPKWWLTTIWNSHSRRSENQFDLNRHQAHMGNTGILCRQSTYTHKIFLAHLSWWEQTSTSSCFISASNQGIKASWRNLVHSTAKVGKDEKLVRVLQWKKVKKAQQGTTSVTQHLEEEARESSQPAWSTQ